MKYPPAVPCLLAILGLSVVVLPASAAEEVNVYSYRQPYLIKPMLDAFTRASGIDVNVVFAKEGLVERLKHEGRNSPADLLLTVDVGRLADAHEAGLTQSAVSPVLEKNLPPQYHGPDESYFGLTTRARIVVASKERLPDLHAIDYEDLADPRFRGRICTRSGKHDYMIALIAALIAHRGEGQTEAWLRGVKENLARKPQGNDRAQVRAVAEGVCDLAVINHYYMAIMLNDEEESVWANAVSIIFPNQGGRGTHLNVSGVALTAHAPHRNNAIKLIEFLSGDLAQQMYAEQNFEYPLNPAVPRSGLLRSFGTFKADDLSLGRISALRSAASKLVDRVDYDG